MTKLNEAKQVSTLKESVLPPIVITPIPKYKCLSLSLPTNIDIAQSRRNLYTAKGPSISIAPLPKKPLSLPLPALIFRQTPFLVCTACSWLPNQTFQELPPLQFHPVLSAQDQWMTDLNLNSAAVLLCTNIAGEIIPVTAGPELTQSWWCSWFLVTTHKNLREASST